MPEQLLTHLVESYGHITARELEKNLKRIAAPWNPDTPIETVFATGTSCRKFAVEGNHPISDAVYVRILVKIITNSGEFDRAVVDWERKSDAEHAVPNAIAHFKRESTHRLEATQALKRVFEANSTSPRIYCHQCTRPPSALAGDTVGPKAFVPTLANTASIREKATTTAPLWTIDRAEATQFWIPARDPTPSATISRPVPPHNWRNSPTESTIDNEGRLAYNVVRLVCQTYPQYAVPSGLGGLLSYSSVLAHHVNFTARHEKKIPLTIRWTDKSQPQAGPTPSRSHRDGTHG
jgi:hypothetical protein